MHSAYKSSTRIVDPGFVTSEVTSSRNLSCTPIISGTSKATNFKFGRYIHTVHPSKSPLKICQKRECGRIRGRPKFFQYLLISQDRVKLRTWEKRERWCIQGLPKFLKYPLLSQERVKLLISNFSSIFRGSMQTNLL